MNPPRFGVSQVLTLLLALVPLALLVLPFAAPALYTPSLEPTAEQLRQARDAFTRHGGTYQYATDARTGKSAHWFRLPRRTRDADLASIPPLAFPFALDLSGTQVTNA